MSLMICEPIKHKLVIGDTDIYPDAICVYRKDTCYEIEKVGGGIGLRTNGSKGVELLVSGRYMPEEQAVLQDVIESFASDSQKVLLDKRDYGKMILLESSLTEKVGDIGGSFSFRFGGRELEYDGGDSDAL